MSDLKKLNKLFETLSFKLQNQFNEIRNNNATWQAKVNTDLDKFKKMYKEMHGVLLNKFLVTLEGRVRLAEINSITLVRLYARKFHEMEKKLDPSFNMSIEDYIRKLDDEIQEVAKTVKIEMEKQDAMAMAEEEKAETPGEETEQGESDGRADAESSQAN